MKTGPENRPSNRENAYFFYKNVPKPFTDIKHQNAATKNPFLFRINLKSALGAHQEKHNTINQNLTEHLSLEMTVLTLSFIFYRIAACS